MDDGDFFDRREDFDGVKDSGFFGLGKIYLGDVGGDDEFRVETGPGEDHLHLLFGRVLGFVEDDEGRV